MSKERPILFSGAMVRALLDGTKKQTRRVYKVRKHPDLMCEIAASELARERQDVIDRICPFGQPGDRLWVREAWRPEISHSCGENACDCETVYVDYPAGGEGRYFHSIPEDWTFPQAAMHGKNVPSLHMPRWASRILLEIVSVRVERLNDISEADARAEGCSGSGWMPSYSNPDNSGGDESMSAKDAFAELWESINGAGNWKANPWVWVVEFKRVMP